MECEDDKDVSPSSGQVSNSSKVSLAKREKFLEPHQENIRSSCLPPDYKSNQLPEHDFMFETLITIDEEFVVGKVRQASDWKLARNKHGDNEKIFITKELFEEIQAVEYYSSKFNSDPST